MRNMKKPGAEPRPVGIGAQSRKESPNSGGRGETLGRMRKLIKEADPDVIE